MRTILLVCLTAVLASHGLLSAEPKAKAKAKRAPNPAMAKIEDVAGLPRVLLIGDSYLGVYQKISPRAAGFSSYLSSTLSVPVSVVMGWGGGPEAPKKLSDRGPQALEGRRLVVWVMSVRDLFQFPGGWSAK